MSVEGATRANDKPSEASFEGEAPLAYASGGGDASPNNCSRFLRADRPYLHVDPRLFLHPVQLTSQPDMTLDGWQESYASTSPTWARSSFLPEPSFAEKRKTSSMPRRR